MSALLKDDVDHTAHDARISQLTREAVQALGAGLSGRALLDELSAEMDKCKALGCFDQLKAMTR